MRELTPEYLSFHARRYHVPQFCVVEDPHTPGNLLLGTSYGTNREFLCSLPVAELGAYIMAHQPEMIAAETRRYNEYVAQHTALKAALPSSLNDIDLSDLGL